MKVTVNYTYQQYQEVATSFRRMLNSTLDYYVDSDVDKINIIEGLEHIIKKMLAKLMTPGGKKYRLSLNNYEIWVIVRACNNYIPGDYEAILLNDILIAIQEETRRLLTYRRNLRENLRMELRE